MHNRKVGMRNRMTIVVIFLLALESCENPASSDEKEPPVNEEKKSAKEITSFSVGSPPVAATIAGTGITAIVPYGTDVGNLVATFTSTGASVAVGTTTQVSGATINDFSNPVTYVVTAEDGSTQSYLVTIHLNMIQDGTFVEKPTKWNSWMAADSGSAVVENGQFSLTATKKAVNEYDMRLLTPNTFNLVKSTTYLLKFSAFSTVDNCPISAGLQESGIDANADGDVYGNWNRSWFNLSTVEKSYTARLEMSPSVSDPNAVLVFYLGYLAGAGSIVIKDVSLIREGSSTFTPPAAPEMILNGDFSYGQNFWWWFSEEPSNVPTYTNGSMVQINPSPGQQRGGMCNKSRGLNIVGGQIYRVSFDAFSSLAGDKVKYSISEDGTDLNNDGLNYSQLVTATFTLTNEQKTCAGEFTAPYTTSHVSLNIYYTRAVGTISVDNVSVKPKQ